MNKVIFSGKDCKFIKSFFDDKLALDGSDPLIVEVDSTTTLNIKRKAKAKYIDCQDKTLIDFLLTKLILLGIISISNNTAKLVKYSEGDYFEKHTDFNKYGIGANYKTLVVQLSEDTSYQGGDLIVEGEKQNREQGSVSIFLSSKIHEVTKVVKGTRWSLTLFLSGSDFYSVKSLI